MWYLTTYYRCLHTHHLLTVQINNTLCLLVQRAKPANCALATNSLSHFLTQPVQAPNPNSFDPILRSTMFRPRVFQRQRNSTRTLWNNGQLEISLPFAGTQSAHPVDRGMRRSAIADWITKTNWKSEAGASADGRSQSQEDWHLSYAPLQLGPLIRPPLRSSHGPESLLEQDALWRRYGEDHEHENEEKGNGSVYRYECQSEEWLQKHNQFGNAYDGDESPGSEYYYGSTLQQDTNSFQDTLAPTDLSSRPTTAEAAELQCAPLNVPWRALFKALPPIPIIPPLTITLLDPDPDQETPPLTVTFPQPEDMGDHDGNSKEELGTSWCEHVTADRVIGIASYQETGRNTGGEGQFGNGNDGGADDVLKQIDEMIEQIVAERALIPVPSENIDFADGDGIDGRRETLTSHYSRGSAPMGDTAMGSPSAVEPLPDSPTIRRTYTDSASTASTLISTTHNTTPHQGTAPLSIEADHPQSWSLKGPQYSSYAEPQTPLTARSFDPVSPSPLIGSFEEYKWLTAAPHVETDSRPLNLSMQRFELSQDGQSPNASCFSDPVDTTMLSLEVYPRPQELKRTISLWQRRALLAAKYEQGQHKEREAVDRSSDGLQEVLGVEDLKNWLLHAIVEEEEGKNES